MPGELTKKQCTRLREAYLTAAEAVAAARFFADQAFELANKQAEIATEFIFKAEAAEEKVAATRSLARVLRGELARCEERVREGLETDCDSERESVREAVLAANQATEDHLDILDELHEALRLKDVLTGQHGAARKEHAKALLVSEGAKAKMKEGHCFRFDK